MFEPLGHANNFILLISLMKEYVVIYLFLADFGLLDECVRTEWLPLELCFKHPTTRVHLNPMRLTLSC